MIKQNKNILLTIGLIIIIFIIIYFDMMKYIAGPYLKNNDNIEVEKAISTALNANEISFYNEYSLDEMIDVYKVTTQNGEFFVFFANNTVYLQIPTSTFDEDKIVAYISKNYNINNYKIKIGMYNTTPIIAIITRTKEIVIDYYTYKEILSWEKN